MLSNVLKTALPDLEQFSMDERHVTLLGKMYYNSFGVHYGTGREDKPEPKERPEEVERTRIPYGTGRQVGTGFYAVSSYLTHSCEPTVQPTFPNGNSELCLVATQGVCVCVCLESEKSRSLAC
jgi:import receptor subunit TOM20